VNVLKLGEMNGHNGDKPANGVTHDQEKPISQSAEQVEAPITVPSSTAPQPTTNGAGNNGVALDNKPKNAPAPPRMGTAIESSDSEDEPLANRVPAPPCPRQSAPAPAAAVPRPSAPAPPPPAAIKRPVTVLDEPASLPAAPKPKQTKIDSDSDDDVPLGQRKQIMIGAKKRGSEIKKNTKLELQFSTDKSKRKEKKKRDKKAKREKERKKEEEKKRKEKRSLTDTDGERARKKARRNAGGAADTANGGGEIKWNTLSHAGVLFPPEYASHGIKMLYDGVPVDLTPEQEEVATFFAVMKETDYMTKPTFLNNFWQGFEQVLGRNHVIKSLEKCDFTPIYEYHMAEREKKKAMTKEEKEAVKREREELEAKYKIAMVDGVVETVGNFRVEPPGLFRGRGEHPKMGKLKRRIFPKDIIINIGEGEPVPEHPFPGQSWKEIRHDKTVTWLASWNDPINIKEVKYVFLAANSKWKSESDLAKYEKARKLKEFIGEIRATYTKNWESKNMTERQMATALYFIDILALRAGHEKDDDEADTVGCCTLKVENVECLPPNHIKFDFLGKDSIRYENTVEVDERVFSNIKTFTKQSISGAPKKPEDQLFDGFDAQDLNVRLKDLMDGLSVKVFRTYNASITLDRLLSEESKEETVEGRKAEYDRANKEVAILCNHQRSIPKGHQGQMEKLQEKLGALEGELKALLKDLKLVKAGKPTADGRKLNPDTVATKIERKKVQIAKAEINAKVKEDLKMVALGTSKINYMDPRITVAWCKKNEVPLEKVFNKSLLSKFLWAMDVEPAYRF